MIGLQADYIDRRNMNPRCFGLATRGSFRERNFLWYLALSGKLTSLLPIIKVASGTAKKDEDVV